MDALTLKTIAACFTPKWLWLGDDSISAPHVLCLSLPPTLFSLFLAPQSRATDQIKLWLNLLLVEHL